jgi:GNAT superfamily N-acetyltransferase
MRSTPDARDFHFTSHEQGAGPLRRRITMSVVSSKFVIRRARAADRNHLRAMQAASMRVLAAPFYSRDEIEGFLVYVGTMDDQLVDEGNYYLVETDGHVVASGGWSRFRSNYVQAHDADPAADLSAAKVRSVFVHPDWAGHGLGRRLMRRAEADAWHAGFNEVELNAMLSGVPFYRRLGYREVRPIAVAMPDRRVFRGVTMRKELSSREVAAPAMTGTILRDDASAAA